MTGMDGGGGKIEEPVEPAAPAVPTKRAPGRPKGTNYRAIDRPLHEEILEPGLKDRRCNRRRVLRRQPWRTVHRGPHVRADSSSSKQRLSKRSE
jgi:hypothetical protein